MPLTISIVLCGVVAVTLQSPLSRQRTSISTRLRGRLASSAMIIALTFAAIVCLSKHLCAKADGSGWQMPLPHSPTTSAETMTAATLSFVPLSVGPIRFASAYDFGCAQSWNSPDPNNAAMDCIKEWPLTNISMLTPPMLPLALLVLLLVFFPLAYACRCCGACGSNMARPGADCCCEGEEWDELAEHEKLLPYPERHVRMTKMVALIITLSGGACVAVMAYGVSFAADSASVAIGAAKVDILDWAAGMLDSVETQARKADGSFIEPITSETFVPFYDLLSWGTDLHRDVSDIYNSYISTVRTALFVASAVPAAAMVVILVLAFFNIRAFAPRILQVVYFLFGVIFGLFGTLLLALGMIVLCLCGELDLQRWAAPGVFQWYIIPQCEEESVFATATATLRGMETDNSANACREAMHICDPSLNFNLSQPDRIFVCPLDGAADDSSLYAHCVNFHDMRDLITQMPFKNGTNALCPSCLTFADCATHCTDPQMRQSTASTLELIAFAGNATDLIDRYLPELSCDGLTTRFIKPLDRCQDMSIGLLLVGGSATYGTVVFIWAIILLCMGQKLFFNRKDLEEEERKAHDALYQRAVDGDDRAATALMRSKSAVGLKYQKTVASENAMGAASMLGMLAMGAGGMSMMANNSSFAAAAAASNNNNKNTGGSGYFNNGDLSPYPTKEPYSPNSGGFDGSGSFAGRGALRSSSGAGLTNNGSFAGQQQQQQQQPFGPMLASTSSFAHLQRAGSMHRHPSQNGWVGGGGNANGGSNRHSDSLRVKDFDDASDGDDDDGDGGGYGYGRSPAPQPMSSFRQRSSSVPVPSAASPMHRQPPPQQNHHGSFDGGGLPINSSFTNSSFVNSSALRHLAGIAAAAPPPPQVAAQHVVSDEEDVQMVDLDA